MSDQSGPQNIAANTRAVRQAISSACDRAGRKISEVTLVGASKFVSPAVIEEAFKEGLRDFGENYVKELAEKKSQIPGATWHYLGPLQSGTVAKVADLADVVQSLGPGRAVEKLSTRLASAGRGIRALVQVDFAARGAGCPPDQVAAFAARASDLPGLDVCGLMTIPPAPGESGGAEDARVWFRKLRRIRDDLQADLPGLRELSMGMSLDYEVAVEEGATMVRVGTALFGERPRAHAQP